MVKRFSFVSCDIVGHSAQESLAVQAARVAAINAIVRKVIQKSAPCCVVWASGGDGGHVAIGIDQPKNLALELIADLRKWSVEENLRLRISAHVGDVEEMEGADGGIQLVGHGINLAGRLLEYADQDRVVVSESFRELYQSNELQGLRFHSYKTVVPKYFAVNTIYLLSVRGEFESSWQGIIEDEQSMITQSFQDGRYWDVIFYAKRLMEANARDASAVHYLSRINRERLTYSDSFSQNERINPLLGNLDSSSLLDLIGATQLVQRNSGEVLCRSGDEGDAMFIILRGDVGVIFAPQPPNAPDPTRPEVVLGPGAMVGELAFTLNRRRTATLQCLSKTWLLSINSDLYDATVERSTSKETLRRTMNRFRLERVLEHICNNSAVLIGNDRSGPLADVPTPWESLADHSSLISQPWKASSVISRRLAAFKPKGLYILVGGELEEQNNKTKVLVEHDLPVVYADLEGLPPQGSPTYLARTNATVLFIREEGFRGRLFTDDIYRRLITAISSSIGRKAINTATKPISAQQAPRLKVLYLASNPFNTQTLQLDLEIREIETKIRMSEHRDSLEAIPKLAVRPDDLQQALLVYKPHLVHFSGHGTTAGELVLEDSNRKQITVRREAILTLFTALPDNLRGILFNACHSSDMAEAVIQVVDFAIGMNNAIADEAAILFASAFYRALGFGKSVQTAFDLGMVAIQMSNVAEFSAIPRLFVRRGVNASSLILITPDK